MKVLREHANRKVEIFAFTTLVIMILICLYSCGSGTFDYKHVCYLGG